MQAGSGPAASVQGSVISATQVLFTVICGQVQSSEKLPPDQLVGPAEVEQGDTLLQVSLSQYI